MHPLHDGEIKAQPLRDYSDKQLSAELEELRTRLDTLGKQVAARTAGVSPKTVHSLIVARAVRLQLFESGLFSDPAWDMLLHLYAQELNHQRVSVSQLCKASSAPATTALRYIGILEQRGLIVRRADGLDARRVLMGLSPAGSAAMRRYFQWLSAAA